MNVDFSWTVLGSSAGIPSADRISTGHLLKLDRHLVLFDCGGGITRAFLAGHHDTAAVSAVFISHMHPDHVSDLPLFIQMLHHNENAGTLDVYLPSEALEPVQAYLDACYLLKEKLSFNLIINPITAPVSLFDGLLTVEALPNPHLKNNAELIKRYAYPNRMESYSFRVTAAGRKIFYTGDLYRMEDIEGKLDNLDLLVTETTHIDTARLISFKDERKIKNIILTHIGDDDLSEVRRLVDNYSSGGLFFGGDNFKLDIF